MTFVVHFEQMIVDLSFGCLTCFVTLTFQLMLARLLELANAEKQTRRHRLLMTLSSYCFNIHKETIDVRIENEVHTSMSSTKTRVLLVERWDERSCKV
ncbi:hypothetical protein T12_10943 [Trichinella patagoniensis]|uniref:Uncharacterized protein n=1 Tax=Trichinella patagoniensis TaxID=990121 RepID=A0A0V1AFG2_9BILA|nr:hypothetical protein T12_10943 [Trichinella patagoniensis]